ncbi:MAG: tRNA (adenosine(37)-N6)-dimethylallyltransferase MiaA [Deltaproteobacteria bacterium]|nr:tRNA (adenosine(37)-N6)-dimethylallyltransferase MiaA [Deltaproteobacteria bacterium]
MKKIKIVVITGPTASGKSALAALLSRLFNGEIISADSMQVYRYMDVGTAKPPEEDRRAVPHHLIDVADPREDYTAERFRKEAADKIREIRGRGKNVFVAGGTGLYIKALLFGIFEGPEADISLRDELLREAELNGAEALFERLKEADPVAASKTHPNNLRRVIRALEVYSLTKRPISEFQQEHGFREAGYDALKIGLVRERAALYRDIENRVDRMMEEGLLDETRALIERGFNMRLKPMRGLGYKEMADCLNGELSLDEAVALLKKNTRRYAKRQMTWFRKDNGIAWFSPEEKEDIVSLVKRHLS